MTRLAHPDRPHRPVEVAETNRQLLDYYLAEGFVEQLADAEFGVEHQHPGYGEPMVGIEAKLGEEVELGLGDETDETDETEPDETEPDEDSDETDLDLG